MHKVESQNMDRVEHGVHDAIISIKQISYMKLLINLKASNDNDLSIVLDRL